MPASGMPSSLVDQRSPGWIGCASVRVPVVTISPAASGVLTGIAGDFGDEEAEGADRAAEHVASVALGDGGAVPGKPDCEAAQQGLPRGSIRADVVALADEERAVEAEGGGGLGTAEPPAGIDRLDDLEAVGDPVDAVEEVVLVHARLGGGREMEHDLRLDARLGKAGKVEARRRRQGRGRSVVDEVPHRAGHAIALPDRGVGEADLAADGALAARLAQGADPIGDGVSPGEIEPGEAGRTAARAEEGEKVGGALLGSGVHRTRMRRRTEHRKRADQSCSAGPQSRRKGP